MYKNKYPKVPDFLGEEGQKKFKSISKLLIDEGKYKDGDDIALSALCAQYERWVKAEREIQKKDKLCFVTESGYSQAIPEISIANNAMKALLAFLKEFALSPRERTKLKEMIFSEQDSDPDMDDLIQK